MKSRGCIHIYASEHTTSEHTLHLFSEDRGSFKERGSLIFCCHFIEHGRKIKIHTDKNLSSQQDLDFGTSRPVSTNTGTCIYQGEFSVVFTQLIQGGNVLKMF